MSDPVSVTALVWAIGSAAGLGTLAGAAGAGVVGNVADRTLASVVGALRNRAGGRRPPAENHDIARALRLAELQALERVLLDFKKWWQAHPDVQPHQDCGVFLDRAVGYCAAQVGRCSDAKLKLNLNVTPALRAALETQAGGGLTDPSERLQQLRTLAEDAVLDELAECVLDLAPKDAGVQVPAPFKEHFRGGGAAAGGPVGKPAWIELFGAYIAEQIKTNDRFRNVYIVDLLLVLKGQQADVAQALTDLQKGFRERFDAAFTELQEGIGRLEVASARTLENSQTLIAQNAEMLRLVKAMYAKQQGVVLTDEQSQAELDRLKARLEATQDDLAGLLRAIDPESPLPSEKFDDALAAAHAKLISARQELEKLRERAGGYPELSEHFNRAATALATGKSLDIDAAQSALAEARTAFRSAAHRNRLRDATTEHDLLCRQAELASARVRNLEAAALYREASRVLLPEQHMARARVLFLAGDAGVQYSESFGGIAALRDAIHDYDAALQIYTHDARPAAWATTQHNRANALQVLGQQRGGEEELDLLRAAMQGYDAALEVFTRDARPPAWAITQHNRADALQALGEQRGGEEGLDLLRAAVQGYDAALEVRTRDARPAEWAMTQNDRANALQVLGQQRGGEEGLDLLRAAVQGYDAALEVFTRHAMPAAWATTQHNRANTLQALGKRRGGEEGLDLLRAAVQGYDAALEVRTGDAMPAKWALTRHNRANALRALGKRRGGEEGLDLLRAAVQGYDAALEVFTRDATPAMWASTQHYRATALQALGEQRGGEEGLDLLRAAVQGFDAALEVRTRDAMPADWATTQNNRAIALRVLGERRGDEEGLELLRAAVRGFDAALEVQTRDAMPADWATTQSNRANALELIRRLGGSS